MRGERLHVRPVLGELLLELGDFGLARRDLGLDLLELGRASARAASRASACAPASARPLRPRASPAPRAGAASRPSRRRRSAARRPRSRACAPRRRRAARGRARRAARCRGTPRARPRAPRGSRGRDGSSARRARGSSRPRRRSRRARAAAARRPTAPRPPSRARPSRRRGTCRAGSAPAAALRPVIDCTHSSTVPRVSSSTSCCEKYAASTPWPRRMRPAAASRRPSTVSSSVVLPEPFGPTSATCSPRSSANVASRSELALADAQRRGRSTSTHGPPAARAASGTRSRASGACA